MISPYLKSWMNSQVDEQRDDRERRKTKHSKWWDFFMIMVLIFGLAVWADQHHDEEMTAGIDREAIMQRQEVSAAQHAMDTELFIMRQAANSATVMDRYHVMGGRK